MFSCICVCFDVCRAPDIQGISFFQWYSELAENVFIQFFLSLSLTDLERFKVILTMSYVYQFFRIPIKSAVLGDRVELPTVVPMVETNFIVYEAVSNQL